MIRSTHEGKYGKHGKVLDDVYFCLFGNIIKEKIV